ncbi:MAG: hypothetical protein WCJ81_08965 [bacterium]
MVAQMLLAKQKDCVSSEELVLQSVNRGCVNAGIVSQLHPHANPTLLHPPP